MTGAEQERVTAQVEAACAELAREAARHNEGEALSRSGAVGSDHYSFAARRLRDLADRIENGAARELIAGGP